MKKYGIIKQNSLTYIFSAFMVCTGLFLTGCWKGSDKQSKLVVINVLDKKMYDDCHITGSINIPFEDLEDRMKSLSKDDEYVFYCSNYACTAAPFSAKMLKDADFSNVSVYHGGIVEWYQKKYPYSGPAKDDYLKEDNEPLDDDDHEVPVIKAEDLKSKLEKSGLLK